MAFWNFWKKKSEPSSVSNSHQKSKPSPTIKEGDKVLVMMCKYCHERIRPGQQHICQSGVSGSSFTAPLNPTQDSSNFILSYAVANSTNNMLMGYVVGGSLVGAMLGASTGSNRATEELSGGPSSQLFPAPSVETPTVVDSNQSEERSSAPSDSSPDTSPGTSPDYSTSDTSPSYSPSDPSPSYSPSDSSPSW